MEKLLRAIFGIKDKDIKFPYRKKDFLLTETERRFYEVLNQLSQRHNVLLFAKVRLEDLLLTYGNGHERFSSRNRIKSRHVDFLLCSKETISPLIAIELDDSSHNNEDRIERDNFVDKALQSAGLPILHVKVKSFYDLKELENLITKTLNNNF